jgi:ParB family chromosome partitioning protein
VSKSVDSFRPDPSNPRKSFNEEELRQLGASLLKKQLVPLIARKNGLLVDGERRWRAAKIVGLQTLDVILIDDNTPEGEVRGIQLITRLHSADLKPFEVYTGFMDWLRLNPGKGGKDLAAAVDRSEALVSMTLSLSKTIKIVQDAAEAGQIGLKDWHTISQLSQDKQELALIAKLRGASAEEIKRIGRKPSNGVRTAKVRCAMPSGVTVTLQGNGEGMTLDDVIETLAELLKEAKRANDQGLDSSTFTRVMRDKAKVG